MSRSVYESKLLVEPFNASLREEYARALGEEGEHESALAQWKLLVQQMPQIALYKQELEKLEDQLNEPTEPESEISETNKDNGSTLSLVQGGRQGAIPKENILSIHSSAVVRFSDIAGMESVKKDVNRRIVQPFVNPGLFQKFKRRSGGGILLYGPPGCGKTMLARAIAHECKAAFHAVGISDILNMFVGQSETNLAGIFDRARHEKPSVLFFDELDALAYSRSKANSDHTRTLVNEFLSQLDGANGDNDQILILGATNMPWDVDDAMKRPGRFDRQVFVPPPDQEARAVMLAQKVVEVPTGHIDYTKVASVCKGFSGADIDGLIDLAKDYVLDDILDLGVERRIEEPDFLKAAQELEPSTHDWLQTARNLVKFGNAGGAYKDVARYLRNNGIY